MLFIINRRVSCGIIRNAAVSNRRMSASPGSGIPIDFRPAAFPPPRNACRTHTRESGRRLAFRSSRLPIDANHPVCSRIESEGSQPKIKVGEVGQLLAVKVPALHHEGATATLLSQTELIAMASTRRVATVASPLGASTILLAAVIKPAGTRFSTSAPPSAKIPIFAFILDGCDRTDFKDFSRSSGSRSDCNRFTDLHHA